MAEDVDAVTHALAAENVLIFGAYGGVGRARVSTHFYNTDADVDRFFEVMKTIPVTRPSNPVTRDFSKPIKAAEAIG
jgi:selenocysteine lyase/cysteine desulfurase